LTEDTFDDMFEVLGDRAKVNPPILINRSMSFTAASGASSSEQSKDNMSSKNSDDTDEKNNNASESEDEKPKIQKKRRTARTIANEAATQMLGVFQKKWEDDKDNDIIILGDEKERGDKYLEILTKSQEHMGAAVDVLRIIANKI
jgi:hypothetical protein